MGRRRSSGDAELVIALVVGIVAVIAGLLGWLLRLSQRPRAVDGAAPGASQDRGLAIAIAGAVVLGGVTLYASTRDNESPYQAQASLSRSEIRPSIDPGPEAVKAAERCVDRADWSCASEQIARARDSGLRAQGVRDRASTELTKIAEQLASTAKRSKRTAREPLLRDAESALRRALAFEPSEPAITQAMLTTVRKDLRRSKSGRTKPSSPSRIESSVSSESSSVSIKPDVAPRIEPTTLDVSSPCAENGSCYGDISATTGRPKTIEVRGYYRRDGTYVRGHYRSRR